VVLFGAGILLFLPPRAYRHSSATLSEFRRAAIPNAASRFFAQVRAWFIKPELVRFRADVFSVPGISTLDFVRLLGRGPNADHAQNMLWFLSPPEVEKLRNRLEQVPGLEVVAQPVIVSSELATGSIFTGESVLQGMTNIPVGLEVNTRTRIRQNRFETFLDFLYSERVSREGVSPVFEIRTNAAFSARLNSYQGGQIMIVSERPQGVRTVCIFISRNPLFPPGSRRGN
jgi:hypothetical protein